MTAIHEAGHCVGYLRYRLPFSEITVPFRPRPGEPRGHLHSLAHRCPSLTRAAVALCGPVAEGWHLCRAVLEVLEDCSSDRAIAMDALRRGGSCSFARALFSAEKLIAARWLSVMRLAEALANHETLSRADVLRVLGASATSTCQTSLTDTTQ